MKGEDGATSEYSTVYPQQGSVMPLADEAGNRLNPEA